MLTVEIIMFDPGAGGRSAPIHDVGYSCDCTVDPARSMAYPCRINFYGKFPIVPGEKRRADMFFLTGDDIEVHFTAVQQFFLSENGSIIGSASARDARLATETELKAADPTPKHAFSFSLKKQGVVAGISHGKGNQTPIGRDLSPLSPALSSGIAHGRSKDNRL